MTNVRTLLHSDWVQASSAVVVLACALIAALWACAVTYSLIAHRAQTAAQPRKPEPEQPPLVSDPA